jgi:polar amino acid transport system substrate-binding protein
MSELGSVIGSASDFNLDKEDCNLTAEDKILLSEELLQASVLHNLGKNATSIVHELRNPLQAIQSYLQILERSQLDSELQSFGYFSALYAEIERMDKLLEQFLRLTRLAPANPQPLLLADLIKEIIPLLASLAKVRGITLHTTIDSGKAYCLCDEQQFKRLLFNLFVNACDACVNSSEPIVHIQLQVEAQELVLALIDNGCGISSDQLTKIWQPFYTSKPSGTGLGLPSCAQFAAEHKGSLTVTSTPEQGSCFTLRLPVL